MQELRDGKLSSVVDRLPLQWREPCNIWVVECTDGIIVRYDSAGGEDPKVRLTTFPEASCHCCPKVVGFRCSFP